MKKRILMSLVATFIIAVSAFAQTNAYSMKLTLKDGTVIVIGPNDLQELNFIEGTPTVSGTNITTLMSSITAMQAQIDALKADLAATEKKVSSAENGITENRYHIKAVEAQIDDNAAATAALKANLDATAAKVKEVEYNIEAAKAQIDKNAYDIASVAERMQANKEELQQAIAMVKAEEDVKIDQAVDDMSKMKEDSDNQIAELRKLIDLLEQRIKQLEEAE